jgi:hypothetical protein
MLQSCGPIGPLVSLVAFSGDEEILDETRCSRAQPKQFWIPMPQVITWFTIPLLTTVCQIILVTQYITNEISYT